MLGSPAIASLVSSGLVANPAASPAFLPTLACLGTLLAASLGPILVAERAPGCDRVLLRRWVVWAAIAPLYPVAVLSGPLVAALFAAVLGIQAAREYAALTGLPPAYRRALLLAAPLPALAALLGFGAHAALPTLLLLAGTLLPLTLADTRGGTRHLALAGFGWAYLPWLLGYLVLLQRDVPGGPEWLVALGLAVALADVGAYLAGRRFGRRKLAPTISPNKTWAGALGSIVGAALGLGLAVAPVAWNHLSGSAIPGPLVGPAALGPMKLVVLALVVAAGAIWGDLVESLLKREHGVKDAGAWLPGFGGLLDRVDSLVLVLPLSYFVLRGGLA